jgi:hypothetical protein
MFNFVPLGFLLITTLPIIFLIFGLVVPHFWPTHKKTISKLMILLGSIGALLFASAVVTSTGIEGLTEEHFQLSLILLSYFVIEVFTIIIGVVQLRPAKNTV